jgi:formate dehydrogenase iron-sulfur subunit
MDIQPADLSTGQAPPGLDPAARAGYSDHPARMGFFTDTSVCIGCKACEVACKEWNAVPEDGLLLTGMSYDNTEGLSASTWRHVAFIEKPPAEGGHDVRWLMSSDVCKHCTEAACLDVCPTGALMRTEFGTVVVQDDVCNGCGYCVSACPFGVIARRESDGGAHKCTLCYDRIGDGLTPACAKACPTESIQFGPLEELRERAQLRVTELHDAGRPEAQLYLADPDDGIGGAGAFFLLLDQPEVYGLPPDPVVTTRDLPRMWRQAALAAAGIAVAAVAVGLAGRA